MKKGLFYTHQGWTDIINCLPLINYYSKYYDELLVMVREDSKNIIDFYIRNIQNVKAYYVDKRILDTNVILPPEGEGFDILYHGFHDRFRKDDNRGKFENSELYFVKRFYECYGIDFSQKVESFNLERDFELENEKYEEFISKYGNDYIIYHDDQNTPGGETGINLDGVLSDKQNKVNINSMTKNVFDFIKIIENAKEVHLVDSIWASVCYLLDAKHEIFKDKTINLYSFKSRSGGLVQNHEDSIIYPHHPKNWLIKSI